MVNTFDSVKKVLDGYKPNNKLTKEKIKKIREAIRKDGLEGINKFGGVSTYIRIGPDEGNPNVYLTHLISHTDRLVKVNLRRGDKENLENFNSLGDCISKIDNKISSLYKEKKINEEDFDKFEKAVETRALRYARQIAPKNIDAANEVYSVAEKIHKKRIEKK